MSLRMGWIVLTVLVSASVARAGYGAEWYEADYWSGEYPDGFAVVGENVVLQGREAVDLDLRAQLTCPVAQKAVYHPWNPARPARFLTESKIVKLTARESFTYHVGAPSRPDIKVKKGDVLEYLIYGSEGFFTFRYQGEEYTGGQDLLEKMEPVSDESFQQDEWIEIPCTNGIKVWILMADLFDQNGNLISGLGDWQQGMSEYGKVHDLP